MTFEVCSNSLASCFQERNNDVERLSSERDYYFKLLDDHNKEFDMLKGQKEQLMIQLEEREKSLTALQVRYYKSVTWK